MEKRNPSSVRASRKFASPPQGASVQNPRVSRQRSRLMYMVSRKGTASSVRIRSWTGTSGIQRNTRSCSSQELRIQ
jgi:hypothetical protein